MTLSLSMAQATTDLITAIRVGTAKRHHSTVVSSAPITYLNATSVSSSRTPNYHCIALRYVCISYPCLCTHHTQCWQDGFFDRTSLHSLGYIFHLGHGGAACPLESPHHQLTIIDTNGWHKVRVTFCKCGASDVSHEHYRQLLRERWYPASFCNPKTAFTFDILETYHKVTLQGKLNLYDFYHAIMQKTDNQGRSKPLVSDSKSSKWSLADQFSNSTAITKSPAACDSGGISRPSNAAVALTTCIPFLRQHLDPSRSSVLPVPTPSETFQGIGMLPLVLMSE